jgi:hypothetical protein
MSCSQQTKMKDAVGGQKMVVSLVCFFRSINPLTSGGSRQKWLVVWNMFFDFPYIGNVIIPTD